MNKTSLRKKYKNKRNQLSQEQIENRSLEIANQLLKLPIWNFLNYHIFLPIKHQKEINTEYILHILQGKDKNIIVPKVIENSSQMDHFLLQDQTVLKPSAYGVPEPVSGIKINPIDLDVVFIPLLAYDVFGNRVGYGKGYYDRFLSLCKPDTVFIGISFFDSENQIEVNKNDIALDFCITPHKIYNFKK